MAQLQNIIGKFLAMFAILFSAVLFAQPCTNPVISSVNPVSGPAGTTVTITGVGFQAGTGISSVKFGGVGAASFTIISDTTLRVVVPAGANSGNISATTQSCTGTGSFFSVINSDCAGAPAGGNEIYISELYDQRQGSGGMVELYNPTNNPIILTGNYVLQRYGNISDTTPSSGYILNLNGTIEPESTFLIAGSEPNPAICVAPPMSNNNTFISGFNDNDKIELLKNGQRIDVAHTPATQPGFTMIRKPDAVAPVITYNSDDWDTTLHDNSTTNTYCSNLGNHGTSPLPSPVISAPIDKSVCSGASTFFEVTVSPTGGFTYEWKMLDATGNWISVSNNANYSGVTTNKLTLTNVPLAFNGNQYYCVATLGSCTLVSNAAQLLISEPAAPVAVVTPATCTTSAIITVTQVAGVTYSIDGTNYQGSNIFNNVAANTYNVTVKNAAGCVSPAFSVTINPAPGTPAAPVAAVTPATCTTAAIITVTPVAGASYSIDGTNYQTGNIFNNVAANTYNVTVKNASGCVSPAFSVTVNPAPGTPAAPVAVVTPATCTTAAIITVTPVTGVTYSIDGTNYQTGNIFTNVAANTYNVTVKNAAGCVSPAFSVTVNPAPGTPAAPVAVVTPATCTTAAIITVTPVTGVTYSIDGTNYQTGNIFNNVAANTYNVTVKNAAGCVSPAIVVTVNFSTGTVPEITGRQGCSEILSGKRYILEALPLNNSFDVATASFEWRDAAGQLLSTDGNVFNITEYVQQSNASLPFQIFVKVFTPGGCNETYVFDIEGIFCDIPRGISPNNDSLNDNFSLAGLNVTKLSVFNRYGREVYSRKDYVNEWQGQGSNGDELPTGTYFYIIETAATSKTGWVYLNRED